MHPTEPKPLGDFFKEGMEARQNGGTLRDNPYSAGSDKRREWTAGFCATVEKEDEDDLGLQSDDGPPPGERD